MADSFRPIAVSLRGIGGPGGGGPAIDFRGDVTALNARFAAAGINVVVHERLADEEDDDHWANEEGTA